ncbi:MAG: trypsin-like peptidase domain-containing protein [Opitutaceae bacterium]|nr:trypsin-like peptidase domain-containing protein [Opitutaceae bacterium]
MKRLLLPCFALGATVAFAAPAAEAEAGRALVKRHADAIIGVELVVTVKMKMNGQELPPRDQPVEVNGTVIAANGLTVTSLAGVDPRVMFEAARAMQGGGQRGPELVSADFKEVKLRLADGKEVPAKFVLKDADLDLAFMAPETDEPGRQFAHVDLNSAAEGTVLGQYFFVARASKSLQRVPLVRSTELVGIVEKPRKLFLISDQSVGSPVFDAAGRTLGIYLQHFASGRPSGVVVLPAADIAEMAKQAAAAQAAVKPAN